MESYRVWLTSALAAGMLGACAVYAVTPGWFSVCVCDRILYEADITVYTAFFYPERQTT